MKITTCSWGACTATNDLTHHQEGSDDGSTDRWAWCPEHEAEWKRRGLCYHSPTYYSASPDPVPTDRLTPEARQFLGALLRLEP